MLYNNGDNINDLNKIIIEPEKRKDKRGIIERERQEHVWRRGYTEVLLKG